MGYMGESQHQGPVPKSYLVSYLNEKDWNTQFHGFSFWAHIISYKIQAG